MSHLTKPRFSSRRIISALFFVTLMLTCAVATSAQGKRPILGGYKEAKVDNPEVVASAEWAVGEQGRKQEMTASLVSIERAETQVVAGSTNFRLCLKVMFKAEGEDEDVEQMVKVVVNRTLQQEYSLTSWEEEECGGSESDGSQEE